MKVPVIALLVAAVLSPLRPALAHDPVFGIGPHTLFKGGVEVHLGAGREEAGEQTDSAAELELKYGITADWTVGAGVSYARLKGDLGTDSGRGPSDIATKYRFWRNDMPGAQASAAVLAKVIFDDSNLGQLQRDGNDYLLGLTYGYEGRKWYRWASVRRRFNAEAGNGLQRPDIWRVDAVIGIRPTPTEYLEPDWVWMLELNGEVTEHVRSSVGDATLRLGGDQWFLSPGLMWTYRNMAVKTGIQFPVYDDLVSGQEGADYRAQLELEWHF